MRIKAAENLAGVPMTRLRKVLRDSPTTGWATNYLQTSLKVSRSRANAVAAALLEGEFIVAVDTARRGRLFRTTTKGLALGAATASTPIHRRTAERLLEQFMERVRIVNADGNYLYTVKTIVLFGSYLSERDDLGDIDIAFALKQRSIADWGAAANELRQRAQEAGRRFRSNLEWIGWPELEVVRYLRSRSRSLRLVELESHRELLAATPHRVLVGTFP